MATAIFRIGETFRGRTGVYTLTKQLQDCIWLASNQNNDTVVFKSIRHFRLRNERDVMLRFRPRTPYIRPLLDEVEEPPALILKYLEDDMLRASHVMGLTRPELKFVARRVLEALDVLHQDGFVHTYSNVLVDYGHDAGIRFKSVALADFGSTVREDSKYALNGDPIGTPIFWSPEAHIQMRWSTSTDIWSFGAMLISLIYGRDFHNFKPDVPAGHDDHDVKTVMKHHQCFGPFPPSYKAIADQERLAVLTWVMESCPADTLRPLRMTTEREICKDDRDFVCRIMKLDPRDRASARDLLEDPWFAQD